MKRMIPLLSILAGLALMAGSAQASITVNWVHVNGGDTVTVLPGASITVDMSVTLTSSPKISEGELVFEP
jgi:hypothetical protein